MFASGRDAYPLIPDEDYHVCPCKDAWAEFIKRAISAHPMTREWPWTEAIVLMQDGEGKCCRKIKHEFVGQA